ncbi:flagellar export chaperone FliS [Alteromonas sp. MB-3u-76]|uniref:flagellar export chaperone FliS n=1 Tax=Alteromonas sp. MB-3u-76 TaxID=2058133 RepID=UPI000C313B58|nr:flagellar export chaperone FliS [Alteromonas sp. MB-3u-76]AUC87632.1 flagellar export chaperone FliS [Alteromonas sp. MB-3u-76]
MSLRGIKAYQKTSVKQDVSTADPHKLTLLLLQGAMDRIAYAKGAIERKDFVNKSKLVTKATSIVMYLRDTLDIDIGGEVAENLYALYDYIIDAVNEGHFNNDTSKLDEAYSLLEPIRDAWVSIPESAKLEAYEKKSMAASNG